MPNLAFRAMAWTLRLMERFRKPDERLAQIGLRPGQTVLEYGCGAGSFTIPAARLVGDEGLVYAVDIHPLAIKMVEKRARKEGLANVRTILTDRDTGLSDESVDVVLLYDTLHLVGDKQALLAELHRVLEPGGFLSADHQHTAREDFLVTMTASGLWAFQAQQDETFSFTKLS
jgi:ubiquinone/menaquinone biosynthesis C-methylase UbiE